MIDSKMLKSKKNRRLNLNLKFSGEISINMVFARNQNF